ncbi:MAG TPA: hypothetical protein VFB36_02890 [Nevskiaceae bacterium]|nr:hypothetical protein [Nevskiaceae bacterium]
MVRRWLYGLFIGSVSLHSHAAKAEPPKRTVDPRPNAALRLAEQQLITAHFNMDAASLGSGVDVDLDLVGFASFHVLLASDTQSAELGRRWALLTGGDSLRRSAKSCSFSGSVDFVSMAPLGPGTYGSRKLVFVPELHFALDTMFGAPAAMNASLRFAHWTSGQERGALDKPVPQLFVRWSF